MSDNDNGLFLIEKRGLYYRPDAAGYTGIKAEAGRYPFSEVAVRVGVNGPDGPTDGITFWREDEAPDYSSGCFWDVRLRHERDRLRDALIPITDRAASAAAYDDDKYNFGWMVDRARAALKDTEDRE